MKNKCNQSRPSTTTHDFWCRKKINQPSISYTNCVKIRNTSLVLREKLFINRLFSFQIINGKKNQQTSIKRKTLRAIKIELHFISYINIQTMQSANISIFLYTNNVLQSSGYVSKVCIAKFLFRILYQLPISENQERLDTF